MVHHVFVSSFYSDRKRGRNDARASDFELRDYCYNSAVQGCVLVLLNTWLQRRDTTGCKWVFKKKFGTDGSVNYKARLVAQGYSQKFGIDFDDVFAPVVRQVTFKTFLSIAGKNKYVIKQFDVSSAFLNGTIDKDVYMRQPEGFKSKVNAVCQLKKSLYGLKQSAKISIMC